MLFCLDRGFAATILRQRLSPVCSWCLSLPVLVIVIEIIVSSETFQCNPPLRCWVSVPHQHQHPSPAPFTVYYCIMALMGIQIVQAAGKCTVWSTQKRTYNKNLHLDMWTEFYFACVIFSNVKLDKCKATVPKKPNMFCQVHKTTMFFSSLSRK